MTRLSCVREDFASVQWSIRIVAHDLGQTQRAEHALKRATNRSALAAPDYGGYLDMCFQ
jgi:hypothetical protein